MATPSPAEPKVPGAAQPAPPVSQKDSREEFIPASSLHGRNEGDASSFSRIGPSEAVTTLRVEGNDPTAGSYRPSTVGDSIVADVLILLALILGAIGFFIWRRLRGEMQENFAGQDHNKD
jgi:hypothetical protein